MRTIATNVSLIAGVLIAYFVGVRWVTRTDDDK